MATTGEVTLESGGKQYGATFSVNNGMLEVKTHTEVRSLELGNRTPEALARQVLDEIVRAQSHPQ
jgi:hypothetical protein